MSQTQGKSLSIRPVSETFHWMPLLGPFSSHRCEDLVDREVGSGDVKSTGLGQANRQSECSHSATCPALPGLEGTPNRIKTSSKPMAEELGRLENSTQISTISDMLGRGVD